MERLEAYTYGNDAGEFGFAVNTVSDRRGSHSAVKNGDGLWESARENSGPVFHTREDARKAAGVWASEHLLEGPLVWLADR